MIFSALNIFLVPPKDVRLANPSARHEQQLNKRRRKNQWTNDNERGKNRNAKNRKTKLRRNTLRWHLHSLYMRALTVYLISYLLDDCFRIQWQEEEKPTNERKGGKDERNIDSYYIFRSILSARLFPFVVDFSSMWYCGAVRSEKKWAWDYGLRTRQIEWNETKLYIYKSIIE